MFKTAKLFLSTTLLLVSTALWCTLCKALRQWVSPVSHMGEQEWKPRKMNKLVNFVFVQPSIHWSKAQFLCFKFSLFPSNVPLTRETETKKVEQFKKYIYSWMIKLTPILPDCKVSNGFCIIQEMKFSKLTQFFLPQFLWWEKNWGNKRKFKTQNRS